MRNIKIVLACFTCLLLYTNLQSLFAQKSMQVYDGDAQRDSKDSVENFQEGASINVLGIYNKYPIRRSNQNKSILRKYYPNKL